LRKEPFDLSNCASIRLLDAGAGVGSLTVAFLEKGRTSGQKLNDVSVTAYELDEFLASYLSEEIAADQQLFHDAGIKFAADLIGSDFIESAVNQLQFGVAKRFNFAILNPPYKKIGSHSRHRLLLRQVGIETVNLYSAFVALALALMEQGGQMVAIIPRSFCNGPYCRPFRDFILERTAIRHMHLFASRDKAFKDDKVLQENVIILLERGGQQGDVTVSTSADDLFDDYAAHVYPFDQIVFPGVAERFIHVPTSPEHNSYGAVPGLLLLAGRHWRRGVDRAGGRFSRKGTCA